MMALHRERMKGILAVALLAGSAAAAMAGNGWLASREGAKVWFMGLEADERCTWTDGHDADNYADGPGVLKRFKKDQLSWTLEGTMKKGKEEGQVKTVTHDGTTYQGGYENGCRSGQGTMKWPDGRTCVGGWANKVPHGRGLMKRPDGVTYEGGYENGLAHGQGTLFGPDGKITMQGKWLNDKFVSGAVPDAE